MVITTTAGRHLVQIKKDGFETLEQWVETDGRTRSQTLTPTLKEIAKPKYGTIVVDADVPDAEVYIDGNKHPDNTPAVISNVIEGLHVIEVKKAPGLPWKQTVQVKANQQTKVRAELAATMHGGVGVVRVLSRCARARARSSTAPTWGRSRSTSRTSRPASTSSRSRRPASRPARRR